ncbi:hypothetical protein [Prescottella agglutinans]|uniref:Uncharacterized protein n=1 Tax=Prescottella agglutinans TaxID=1644129 RepID=A0ABT6MJF2_9NOCA|nr:hypothetical protein [Prescottella agglutinans]MDH6284030.1 hypothetical protein [Prescottella agglutinans]
MGQYHKLVNVDTKEYLHPDSVGGDTKFSGLSNWRFSVGFCLSLLIAPRGPWHGSRLVLVGDYATDDQMAHEFRASTLYDGNIEPERGFRSIEGEARVLAEATRAVSYSDISEPFFGHCEATRTVNDSWVPEPGPEMVVVNSDRREMLDPLLFGDGPSLMEFGPTGSGGVMTATLTALSVSTGRDGSWGHSPGRVAIIRRENCTGFTDISTRLREAWSDRFEYRIGSDGTVTRHFIHGRPVPVYRRQPDRP